MQWQLAVLHQAAARIVSCKAAAAFETWKDHTRSVLHDIQLAAGATLRWKMLRLLHCWTLWQHTAGEWKRQSRLKGTVATLREELEHTVEQWKHDKDQMQNKHAAEKLDLEHLWNELESMLRVSREAEESLNKQKTEQETKHLVEKASLEASLEQLKGQVAEYQVSKQSEKEDRKRLQHNFAAKLTASKGLDSCQSATMDKAQLEATAQKKVDFVLSLSQPVETATKSSTGDPALVAGTGGKLDGVGGKLGAAEVAGKVAELEDECGSLLLKLGTAEAAGAEKEEALQHTQTELVLLKESESNAAALLVEAECKVAELEDKCGLSLLKLAAVEAAATEKDVVCTVALQSAEAELASLKESASSSAVLLAEAEGKVAELESKPAHVPDQTMIVQLEEMELKKTATNEQEVKLLTDKLTTMEEQLVEADELLRDAVRTSHSKCIGQLRHIAYQMVKGSVGSALESWKSHRLGDALEDRAGLLGELVIERQARIDEALALKFDKKLKNLRLTIGRLKKELAHEKLEKEAAQSSLKVGMLLLRLEMREGCCCLGAC